jgi:dipeptidase E
LGCGSADDEVSLWRLMLHRLLTRIVYWPFALPASMLTEADVWLRDRLDQVGATYTLETWSKLEHHTASDLDGVDLLFVGGGNTFRLLDHVGRAGFLDPVRRFVADGGDYYGGSAGAVLACDDIAVAEGHDPNDVGLSNLTALGLLHGVSVLPHFTESQLESAQRCTSRHRRTLIGLPENAGLRVYNGIVTVVGDGTVYVIDQSSTSTHSADQTFVLE